MTTDPFNRFKGARSTYAYKKPVRAATTGSNITLSGFQTIDGITYSASDVNLNMRCLVKDQADSTQNGIYTVNSGDWVRETDFDGNTDFTGGTRVYVSQGTINGGRVFYVSSADPQNIGTSATAFSRFGLDAIVKHGADIINDGYALDLDGATGEIVDVDCNSLGIGPITLSDGRVRIVRFVGSTWYLIHGGSLILPGGQNILIAVGDYAVFVGYTGGIVRCVAYVRADGHYLTTQTATVVSAAATDLGSDISQCITVSGSVTITSFGATAPAGAVKFVYFSGAPLLTNGANLILPGGQNIQVIAGDCLIARADSAGVWRVVEFLRGNSHPLITGLAALASAATVDLGSVREQYIAISGSIGITSFGTSAPTGAIKSLIFSAAPYLTYGANLILPGGRDIQALAGDTLAVVYEGSGVWRGLNYTRATSKGLISIDTTPVSTTGSTLETNLISYSLPGGTLYSNGDNLQVQAWGSVAATTSAKRLRLYFGGVAAGDTGSLTLNGLNWRFASDVIRISSAAEQSITTIHASNATSLPSICQYTTPSEIVSTSAVTIKVTGQSDSTAASEITALGMSIKLISLFQ